jgi:hypothetical protein
VQNPDRRRVRPRMSCPLLYWCQAALLHASQMAALLVAQPAALLAAG